MTVARNAIEDQVGEVCRSLRRLLGGDDPLVARTLHDLALQCDAAGRKEISASLWSEARRSLPGTPDEVSVVVADGEEVSVTTVDADA